MKDEEILDGDSVFLFITKSVKNNKQVLLDTSEYIEGVYKEKGILEDPYILYGENSFIRAPKRVIMYSKPIVNHYSDNGSIEEIEAWVLFKRNS